MPGVRRWYGMSVALQNASFLCASPFPRGHFWKVQEVLDEFTAQVRRLSSLRDSSEEHQLSGASSVIRNWCGD